MSGRYLRRVYHEKSVIYAYITNVVIKEVMPGGAT